jgi:hypothetical protein
MQTYPSLLTLRLASVLVYRVDTVFGSAGSSRWTVRLEAIREVKVFSARM